MEENTTEGLNCGSEEELTALEGDIEEVGLCYRRTSDHGYVHMVLAWQPLTTSASSAPP